MEEKIFTYKNANTSPRKANILLDLMVGKTIDEAMLNLDMSEKKASKMWKKLLKSATGYFEDKGYTKVTVQSAYTGPGITLKRGRPSARLHFFPMRKMKSNLFVKLKGTK